MNSTDVIVSIRSIDDIEKITSNTKYINLSILDVTPSVIEYFLTNGSSYLYSEMIGDKCGFVYADFATFKKGEMIINELLKKMPIALNELEKARYIYIYLGKILSSDINTMREKCDDVSFNNISLINNIWGSLASHKVTSVTASKIFMYVCARISIKCELVQANVDGEVANRVHAYGDTLLVRLFSDIYNIQGGFRTKYFDKYNEDKIMDKRVNYILDEYADDYIDKALMETTHTKENVLYNILLVSSKFIDISSVGPMELAKIFGDIFAKYAPNYDIKINNLFVYNYLKGPEHFIVFNYKDTYYSFNYNKKCFIFIDPKMLYSNILNDKIGVYEGEDFSLMKKGYAL